MVFLDVAAADIGFRQRRKTAVVEEVHRVRAGEQHVEAVRRLGNLPQQLLVEPRLHDVTLVVADIIGAPFAVVDAQELAVGRADADRENAQAFAGGFFRGVERLAGVVFTVGEKNHYFIVVVLALEGGAGGFDRLGQRGPALGNDVHVQRIHVLAKRFVIKRERTLQERAASKRDKTHAIGLREAL